MNKNKAMTLALITCMTAAMITGCKKKYEEVDLSSHTTAAAQPSTVAPTQAETTAAQTGKAAETEASAVVKATIETYTKGDMKVQYPAVSGLSDESKQEDLNKMLKDNATAFIKGWGIDDDAAVDVTCKVISINKKQICATYEGSYSAKGAAHPNNIFFTNTIDLESMKNLGFSDYADPYTQAGYVLSSDVQLRDGDADQLDAFKSSREEHDINYYKKLFENADFPADGGSFPECFSYTKDGNLYYSVPVSHAAGDYVIVKFSLEGK